MPVRRRIGIAAVAPAPPLGGAADASARTVWLGGHVLSLPASAGPSASVPVMLTRAPERRVRVAPPLVRLLVRRRASGRVLTPAVSSSSRERRCFTPTG